MTAHLTLMAQDAHAAATRDRAATANLVLELAMQEAVDLIRAGRPGRAEWVLVRAGMRAQRILGSAS